MESISTVRLCLLPKTQTSFVSLSFVLRLSLKQKYVRLLRSVSSMAYSYIILDHSMTKVREIKLIPVLIIITTRNPHTPTHNAIHAYPLSHSFSPNRPLRLTGNKPERRNLNIPKSGSATHGHLPENLNSSPSNPDIVDLIKEVKEGVKRIGNNLANCVEKMSFVMSTMESMSRRLDRIEARLGIQDTHPQRVAGVRRSDMAIGYVVNFNGNYYLQSMFHPPAPLFNPVSGDQVMMDAEDQFDNPRNP